MLIQYADNIIGYHRCGFVWNLSTVDCMFCIQNIHEKKWEYSLAVYQTFIDLRKIYGSVKNEVCVWCLYETS